MAHCMNQTDFSKPPLAQVRWRCRLGMRELDEMLTAFVSSEYEQLAQAEIVALLQLLQLAPPQLNAYLLGQATPVEPAHAHLVERIRTHITRSRTH